MAINTIKNDIITQLKSSISDLKVEEFPDKPAEYKLIHSKGAVLVHFLGTNYNEPDEQGFIQQTANLRFGLTLMIKGLRDKNGAYAYIDSIISTLTGFTPTGCTKMYPVRVGFLTENDGVWQYTFTFVAPTENYS